jgi:DNA processing protein
MPDELFPPEKPTVDSEQERSGCANQELLDVLRLNLVPGVGPRTFQMLLERFGSPSGILNAKLAQLQEVPNVGPKLAMSVVTHGTESAARAELERVRAAGVSLLVRDRDEYPPSLGRIPDPPTVLYCRGELKPSDQLAVGIVGSRHCTAYGRQQANRIAQGLARSGITIVSGLARGIDAEAHKGALEAGGRTIAVCATGLGTVYPPEHAELADSIAKQGCLLTESPMEQQPKSGLFPQRNRIISGISLGVILIEAGRNSGALHTARHAMEQNREVFAVPGRIDSEASFGCLDLIRDGATLIRGVDDVLEALGPLVAPVQRSAVETVRNPAELQLSEQQRAILNLIAAEPVLVDEVLRGAGIEPSRVLSTLTILEMKRLVRRLPGGFVQRY